jgi:hypothetical protein
MRETTNGGTPGSSIPAGGAFVALDQVDVRAQRRLGHGHARNRTIVEIRLIDCAVGCRDLATAREASGEDRRALELRTGGSLTSS